MLVRKTRLTDDKNSVYCSWTPDIKTIEEKKSLRTLLDPETDTFMSYLA